MVLRLTVQTDPGKPVLSSTWAYNSRGSGCWDPPRGRSNGAPMVWDEAGVLRRLQAEAAGTLKFG